MPTVNATHRKRLARALAAELDISYAAALERITQAAHAGALPSRLDQAGMKAALRLLTAADTPEPTAATPVRPHDQTPSRSPRSRHKSDLTTAEANLLALVQKTGGRAHIAGIVECQAALALSAEGLVRIEAGDISAAGGSGFVALVEDVIAPSEPGVWGH